MRFDDVLAEAQDVLKRGGSSGAFKGVADGESVTEGRVTKEVFAKLTKLLVGEPSEMSTTKVVLDYRDETGGLVAQVIYRKGKDPIYMKLSPDKEQGE